MLDAPLATVISHIARIPRVGPIKSQSSAICTMAILALSALIYAAIDALIVMGVQF